MPVTPNTEREHVASLWRDDRLSIREIVRRTGIARNTVRSIVRSLNEGTNTDEEEQVRSALELLRLRPALRNKFRHQFQALLDDNLD